MMWQPLEQIMKELPIVHDHVKCDIKKIKLITGAPAVNVITDMYAAAWPNFIELWNHEVGVHVRIAN